jgi:hypothetical protein
VFRNLPILHHINTSNYNAMLFRYKFNTYKCEIFRCREKMVKFLDSNPFQIALCLFILIDAGVVIAEILLDLHAIRGTSFE